MANIKATRSIVYFIFRYQKAVAPKLDSRFLREEEIAKLKTLKGSALTDYSKQLCRFDCDKVDHAVVVLTDGFQQGSQVFVPYRG